MEFLKKAKKVLFLLAKKTANIKLNDLALVIYNIKDFKKSGIELFNLNLKRSKHA